MRRGVIAAIFLFGFGANAQPQGEKSKDEIHILFIGNSLTYYHNLPKMVAELAKAGKQRPLRHERETPGGCTFEKHWKDGKALGEKHLQIAIVNVIHQQSGADSWHVHQP